MLAVSLILHSSPLYATERHFSVELIIRMLIGSRSIILWWCCSMWLILWSQIFFVWNNIYHFFSYCDARERIDPLLPQSALSGYNSWSSRDQTAIESEPLKWKNGLSDLLRHQHGQEAFAKFLKSEYSGENLTFWLQTRRYRRAPGILKIFQQVHVKRYKDFVGSGKAYFCFIQPTLSSICSLGR